jgi:transposase
MKRATKYVGLDVHQATTSVAVRDERDRLIAQTVLATEAEVLVEYFRGMRGTVHVTFEEGAQAQWLHDLLEPVVSRVLVCDRRGESKRGNKGDAVDAAHLSAWLRQGRLRAVYHGSRERANLKELGRAYRNIVEDATRVMSRLKALFRARGITTAGKRVYHSAGRAEWIAKLAEPGARFRAEALYRELAVLRQVYATARTALLAEARRDPAWRVLRTIPFFGPIRVALLLATLQTPWRFRTKRHLWAYAGLAVVTRTTAEYEFEGGRPRRHRRPPLTRGLNRNHNPVLKNILKSAATAAASRPGPLQEWYQQLVTNGMRPELARVTVARKLAGIALRLWKTGVPFDPTQLTVQAR